MFERLSRSWDLVKASGSVLRQDKEMLVFPLIHTALSGIYAAALYRYATEGSGTAGFEPKVLENAFAQKK